jgi:hypothetical protein
MQAKSKVALRAGWIISIPAILFLLMDSIMKLLEMQPAIEGTLELGYPQSTVFILGLILLISTLLYSIPLTSFIGAILLTAYLGGAVSTHMRLLNPLFSHTLFPVYIGIMIWAGLFLRNKKLKL